MGGIAPVIDGKNLNSENEHRTKITVFVPVAANFVVLFDFVQYFQSIAFFPEAKRQ